MKTLINTQSRLARFLVAASFASLGFVGIAATAQAQEATHPKASAESTTTNWSVTYPVRYSDVDVSTATGAKTLYLRIRFAAETLCGSAATWGKKEGDACVNKAVDDAVTRVNAPLLTQYSQLRSKSDNTGLVQLANTN